MGFQLAGDLGNRLTPAVTAEIIKRKYDLAPKLAAMLAEGRVQRTGNELFKWYDNALAAYRTQVDDGGDALDDTSTVITVDSSAGFRPNTVVLFESTREVGLVTAVGVGTITVIRGWGATVAQAGSVDDDDWIRAIGFAAGEGTNVPDANHGAPTDFDNYVQHFKRTIKRTGRAQRSETLTEDELGRLREDEMDEMLREMEWALTHGVKGKANDANGDPVTTMDGIYAAATLNVTNVAGLMSFAAFKTAVKPIFQYARTNRLRAYCGPLFIDSVVDLAMAYSAVSQSETVFGMEIDTIRTPWGLVDLMPDWSFNDVYEGDAWVHVPNRVRLRSTRRTELESGEPVTAPNGPAINELFLPHMVTNVQAKGQDGKVDLLQAEVGVEWGSPAMMGMITGVTGAQLA